MTVTIKRVAHGKYVLIGSDGSEIARYEQVAMEHPTDWMDDVEAAGESVHGPYDWEYVDERDTE